MSVAATSAASAASVPSAGAGDRRRVILLTGPSGAGKSRLAERLSAAHGWPVVRLDDFYREGDDPHLPRSPLGIPDWDHVDSWNADAACTALARLVDEGGVDVPVYDIGASAVTGHHRLTAGPDAYVLAEGLFAGRLVAPLQSRGLLADALCIRQNRLLTAVRRFARDLSERRKPPWVLARRGLALYRDEPHVIAQAEADGALCQTPHEAERRLAPMLRPGSA